MCAELKNVLAKISAIWTESADQNAGFLSTKSPKNTLKKKK